MPKATPPAAKVEEPDWLKNDAPAAVAVEVQAWPSDDPRMGVPDGWEMIHTLISRILADVGPVLKTQRNLDQKYDFRGVDQVVNAVNAAFKRHRVYPTSRIVEASFRATVTTRNNPTREVTGRIVYRFTAPDGSFQETEVLTEALDTSDKGGPKAMSVGLRIALLQMLLLPTGDPTTDHDGHYLTRDGLGPMSTTARRLAVHMLRTAAVDEVALHVLPMLREHAAWDQPMTDVEGALTWGQAASLAMEAKLTELPSHAEVARIKALFEQEHLLGIRTPGGTMLEHLRARWTVLAELYAKTLDHVVGHVLAANGRDELAVAVGCGEAACDAGTLRIEDLTKVRELADERHEHLPSVAPHDTEPTPAEEETDSSENEAVEEQGEPYDPSQDRVGHEPVLSDPEDYGFKPTRDDVHFLSFKTRAINAPVAGVGELATIREAIVEEAIVDLLSGETSNDPAANYGEDGFVLVEDAIKAAHRRERTIGDATRAELDKVLAEYRGMGAARTYEDDKATEASEHAAFVRD